MAEQSFMRAEEVAQELGVSKSYAYKIVQKLNQELKEKGWASVPWQLPTAWDMKASTSPTVTLTSSPRSKLRWPTNWTMKEW